MSEHVSHIFLHQEQKLLDILKNANQRYLQSADQHVCLNHCVQLLVNNMPGCFRSSTTLMINNLLNKMDWGFTMVLFLCLCLKTDENGYYYSWIKLWDDYVNALSFDNKLVFNSNMIYLLRKLSIPILYTSTCRMFWGFA